MPFFVSRKHRNRTGRNENELSRKKSNVTFFGHFGKGNFGNESTLQAILHRLRRVSTDADIACICTDPEAVAAAYKITAIPITYIVVKPWPSRNPLVRLVRKATVGIASECYRWLKGILLLRRTDVLIIPGTGLLTDAYSLVSWGPYSMFKWSVIAKLCRCKLFFVSVGAGPLYSRLGKWLVKTALFLADFRSYRDDSTLKYVKSIGFHAPSDAVYPDLAFSLPVAMIPAVDDCKNARRKSIGIGLMEYAGKYSIEKPNDGIYRAYLDALRIFVQWLLAHDYDVRLLCGDVVDQPVIQEFISLLHEKLVVYDEGRIINEPVVSVENLLSQLAATDIVVATRFHNVLLALVLNKPTLSISFHHKCTSLMCQMGLEEYSHDINDLAADDLIAGFCKLEQNADSLRPMIEQKTQACRNALDEQYRIIFQEMGMFPNILTQ